MASIKPVRIEEIVKLNSGTLTDILKPLTDGNGSELPVSMSNTEVSIKGEMNSTFATEAIVDHGNVFGALELDTSKGSYFLGKVEGAVTISFSTNPSTGRVYGCILELTNGGAYTVMWPNNIRWEHSTAPTLSVDKTDLVGLITRNGGATWYGTVRLG